MIPESVARAAPVDLLWSVIVLLTTGITILLCVLAGLSMILMGITRQSIIFGLLLGLLLVSETLMFVLHVVTIQTLYVEGLIFFRVKGFALLLDQILLFCILLELTLRWMLAVLFVAYGDLASQKLERSVQFCFHFAGVVVVTCLLIVTVIHQFYPALRGLLTAKNVATGFVHVLSCCFAAFLVWACAFVFRHVHQRKGVDKKIMHGIKNLWVVFCVLFVCILLNMCMYFARQVGVGDMVIFVPYWFQYAILYGLCRVLQSWALLYTFYNAARSIYLSKLAVSAPLMKPLIQDEDNVELSIPKKYLV